MSHVSPASFAPDAVDGVVGRRAVFPNEAGMNASVEFYTEDPQEFLKRALAPGEVVIEQFDVYFPTMMIPKWKLILLCISTLGLYLLVLLFRAIQRFCYRHRCCTPAYYELLRGKMAVTNKGRMIFWEQFVRQAKIKAPPCMWLFKCCCKDTCAAPVKYTIFSNAKSMKIEKVRQISQFYSSMPACFLFWCCCLDYECGVELAFGEFNHKSSGAFLTSAPNTGMASFMQTFTTWTNRSLSAVADSLGSVYGLTTRSHIMYIVSSTKDMVRNGDVDAVMDDINELFARVIKCLPADTMKESFAPNASIPIGKFGTAGAFKGVTVIDSDMSVTIPAKYFQLTPGEKVINSIGLVYRMSCMDYIRVCCSFGYYYCSVLHHIKSARAAIVITNRRVIVVDLVQRAGMIPSHLGSFHITIRCYIPGDIHSGYINSESYTDLESAIVTDGGMLKIDFPRLPGADTRKKFLPFAKAFQQSVHRLKSFSTISADVENQKVAVAAAKDIQDFNVGSNIKIPLDKTDMELIPFVEGEKVIDFIRGVAKFQPFCNMIYWMQGKQAADASTPQFCCEKGKNCFPIIPYILTCALRPFRKLDDIIFTNNSIIQYVRTKNEGCCGFCGPICKVEPFFWPCDGSSMICQTNASFFIAWAPVTSLMGHTVQYEYEGLEMWYSRLCMHNMCGRICCPVNDASYSIVLHAGNFDFVSNGTRKNENWKNNEAMQRAEKLVIGVEVMGR